MSKFLIGGVVGAISWWLTAASGGCYLLLSIIRAILLSNGLSTAG